MRTPAAPLAPERAHALRAADIRPDPALEAGQASGRPARVVAVAELVGELNWEPVVEIEVDGADGSERERERDGGAVGAVR